MIEPPEELQTHYYEINTLDALPALIRQLENGEIRRPQSSETW
jgi:hypothetical protein